MKKDAPLLVILIPGFPEGEQDTSCLPFAQSLMRSINKEFPFIEIIIFSFQYPFSRNVYLWNGNIVIPFNGRNKGKLLKRLLWMKVWKQLKKVTESRNMIGLFSLWCGECALIGHRFADKFGIPHFCWIAGQDAKAGNRYVHKIKPRTSELVAISDFIADEFLKNYLIRPLHVIPNGIEEEMFEKTSYTRTIDVLGAGSLITLKRYDIFIDCILEIKKTIPRIYSVLAGKGELKFTLQQKTRQNNLEENILLNGEMAHKNLLTLMQQSKVFLHPSCYEGFSMVCQEALYAGCHVISFCKPMTKDLDHWHIVNTQEEMVEKVLEILNNPHTEYSRVLPYSINETAKAVLKLFD